MTENEIYETVLLSRNISRPEQFLDPDSGSLLPLNGLKRIEEAYSRLKRAVDNNEKIMVYYDSDTDGITSGTIIMRYLMNLTNMLAWDIPYGKKHGLMSADWKSLSEADLLIVVDSLDSDVHPYKVLHEDYHMDIIILDHHAIKSDQPYDDCAILVSSQRDYDNPQLSGAGVCWKFCKYYDQQEGTNYADSLVDLAACGLVADMMDMTNMENRYIVNEGLKHLQNPFVKKVVGSFDFNSTAIAFSIAPIVNAANRLGKNENAVHAFLTNENKEVLAEKRVLTKCKEAQNKEVADIMAEAIAQCDSQIDHKVLVVMIDTKNGIAGLIGNKLLEKYQRPILILKDCGDRYMGSMRAVGVDDFRKICNDSGLAQCDGHELAAGITIPEETFVDFINYLEEHTPDLNLDEVVDIDVQLNVEDITRSLIDKIKKLDRISGSGFKPIKFYIDGIEEYDVGMMSDYKHLVIKPNGYLNIIKWNFTGSWDKVEDASVLGEELYCVATLDSGWLGRSFMLKAICDEIGEVDSV